MKIRMEAAAQAICTVVSVGGLVLAGWVLVSGLPEREGIDAMFLLVVGLAFAALFGAVPLQAIRRREWRIFSRHEAKTEAGHDRSANA